MIKYFYILNILSILALPLNNLSFGLPIDSFNLSSLIIILYFASVLFFSIASNKKVYLENNYFFLFIFLLTSLIMINYFYFFEESLTSYRGRDMATNLIKSFASFSFIFIHYNYAKSFDKISRIDFKTIIKYVYASNIIFLSFVLLEVLIMLNIIDNTGLIGKVMLFINDGYDTKIKFKIAGTLRESSVSSIFVNVTYIPLYFSLIYTKLQSKHTYALLILNIFFLAFTKSRVGIVALIVLSFIFLLFVLINSNLKRKFYFLTGAVVLVTIVAQAFYNELFSVLVRVFLNINQDVSYNTRFILMFSGLNIFTDYPLFGIGSGNFGFLSTPYLLNYEINTELYNLIHYRLGFWLNPTSVSVKFLVEYGLVGTLLLIIFVLSYLKKIKLYKSEFINIYFFLYAISMLLASLGIAIYHNFYYLLYFIVINSFLQQRRIIYE